MRISTSPYPFASCQESLILRYVSCYIPCVRTEEIPDQEAKFNAVRASFQQSLTPGSTSYNQGPVSGLQTSSTSTDLSQTGPPSLLLALPNELLSHICLLSDLQSLQRIRQTNHKLRELIDALQAYYNLRTHATGFLIGLHSTRAARSITLERSYALLRTDRCVVCRCFGAFINLAVLERCCYSCADSSPELRLVAFAAVESRLKARGASVRGALPVSVTVPAWYFNFQKDGEVDVEVMHRASADAILVAGGYEERAVGEDKGLRDSSRTLESARMLLAVPTPYLDGRGGEPDRGSNCRGCWFVAGQLHNGHMYGNTSSWMERVRDAYARYSTGELLEHFRWCWMAQQLFETETGLRAGNDVEVRPDTRKYIQDNWHFD